MTKKETLISSQAGLSGETAFSVFSAPRAAVSYISSDQRTLVERRNATAFTVNSYTPLLRFQRILFVFVLALAETRHAFTRSRTNSRYLSHDSLDNKATSRERALCTLPRAEEPTKGGSTLRMRSTPSDKLHGDTVSLIARRYVQRAQRVNS